MEYLKIHQVLGALTKNPEQYIIEVKLVETTLQHIKQYNMNKHPDIEAGYVKIVSGWDEPKQPEDFIRITPGSYGYFWNKALKKYGFMPREAAGEEPSDHIIYVENKPEAIKGFVNMFERLKDSMPETKFYVNELIRKVYSITIGADKLNSADTEAILNL